MPGSRSGCEKKRERLKAKNYSASSWSNNLITPRTIEIDLNMLIASSLLLPSDSIVFTAVWYLQRIARLNFSFLLSVWLCFFFFLFVSRSSAESFQSFGISCYCVMLTTVLITEKSSGKRENPENTQRSCRRCLAELRATERDGVLLAKCPANKCRK